MSDDKMQGRKIPMNKKLILLVALLSGISVVAMDHTKEMPSERKHLEMKEPGENLPH